MASTRSMTKKRAACMETGDAGDEEKHGGGRYLQVSNRVHCDTDARPPGDEVANQGDVTADWNVDGGVHGRLHELIQILVGDTISSADTSAPAWDLALRWVSVERYLE